MGASSMTGFGRATGQAQDFQWTWEAKSVNSKGRDIRVRVPAAVDGLDIAARRSIAAKIERGSITANLSLSRDPGHETVVVREEALDQLIAITSRLGAQDNIGSVSIDGLLSINGLVEIRDQQLGETEQATLERALLEGLEEALEALVESRRKEGEGLISVLTGLLQEISEATRRAAANEGATQAAIRERFEAKLNDLLGSDKGLDDNRLAQEVALLAIKADIREEIDRLGLHNEAARELLNQSGPIGRQLEFIAQELVREANTLCSKSGQMDLTTIGLELKSKIDRFREQVQNIE
jgi:uncharacterized protein (TIGR00255 family)